MSCICNVITPKPEFVKRFLQITCVYAMLVHMDCRTHSKIIRSLLRRSKLKVTQARLGIVDVFVHATRPLTVGELKTRLPVADNVTLYRNVLSLSRSGILAEVHVSSKEAHYELSDLPHHHHLICQACGKMADVQIREKLRVSPQQLRSAGFSRVDRHSLEFFGRCVKCGRK